MRSEMRPLGEFVSLVSGNTPSKANAAYWGGTTPWVSAKDMGDFWIEDAEDHLTPAGVDAASRLVPAGTVLMLTRGMTLHKRVPICRVAKPSTFNQDVKAVLPKASLSTRYLPYLLVGNHDRLHERVDSAGHGTGRLNTDSLLSFPVYVPGRGEQESIAELGEAIDDRLRLLRQTNTTLESIAQALFKSWFIDFDPVRAKAEGREPEGMDAATAALFPSEFEESELGLIPKGWKIGSFGDLARLAKGSVNPMASPDVVFEHFSLPAFDASQLPTFELGSTIKSNKTRVSDGAVLQSKLNPHIPRVWFPSQVGNHAVCSTEFLPWLAREPASPEVLYCALTAPSFEAVLRTLVTGTSNSHQRVKPDQVAGLSLAIAPGSIYDAFTSVARPLLAKVGSARWRVKSLAYLRDALLPRLISGKLRIPEAQDRIEEALA